MNSKQTKAIVLKRVDYGESDRIITVLSSDAGKLSLIAKGSRKLKSKLAGSIELFSIFSASYLPGRGEVSTLVSARLDTYYSEIVKDIERVQLGYEALKIMNKNTEDHVEAEYFDLLQKFLTELNNYNSSTSVIRQWYLAQLLALAGHQPNLISDEEGKKLDADSKYSFDPEHMRLVNNVNGRLGERQIKYLRLLFADDQATQVFKLVETHQLELEVSQILETMFRTYLSL